MLCNQCTHHQDFSSSYPAYQDVFKLFDCLNVYKCHGVAIPPGITDDLYDRIVNEATYVLYNMYAYPTTPEAAKVGIGFFVKEVENVSEVVYLGYVVP